MLLLSPVDTAFANKVVYLLFGTAKNNENEGMVETAPLIPSVAEMVNVNEPAFASAVLGVTVNTLSACDTVAILPSPEAVYVQVNGNPSGSVDTAVIVVAVPSIASEYDPLTPVIALGASFCTVAIKYQPTPV